MLDTPTPTDQQAAEVANLSGDAHSALVAMAEHVSRIKALARLFLVVSETQRDIETGDLSALVDDFSDAADALRDSFKAAFDATIAGRNKQIEKLKAELAEARAAKAPPGSAADAESVEGARMLLLTTARLIESRFAPATVPAVAD